VRIIAGVAARTGDTAPTETAPLHSVERLPATKYGEAAKNEGTISDRCTETSILLRTRQPGPAGEAPDNSRKIAVGKS
jgi:hypothetical protein